MIKVGFRLWSSRDGVDDGIHSSNLFSNLPHWLVHDCFMVGKPPGRPSKKWHQWPWCHLFFCRWVRRLKAPQAPSFSGWKLQHHWCFNSGPGYVMIFRFELRVWCHLCIYIYEWYTSMIDQLYVQVVSVVSCADTKTRRFTADPNFSWCFPPGAAIG